MAFAPKLLINKVPKCEDGRVPEFQSQIIFQDTNPKLTLEERKAKRRRIEEHAEAYLRGGDIHIESSGLRGPFNENWQSPWRSAGFVPQKKPAFKPEEHSLAVLIPAIRSEPKATEPQKKAGNTGKRAKATKAKSKKAKHDTSFFKALPMAKNSEGLAKHDQLISTKPALDPNEDNNEITVQSDKDKDDDDSTDVVKAVNPIQAPKFGSPIRLRVEEHNEEIVNEQESPEREPEQVPDQGQCVTEDPTRVPATWSAVFGVQEVDNEPNLTTVNKETQPVAIRALEQMAPSSGIITMDGQPLVNVESNKESIDNFADPENANSAQGKASESLLSKRSSLEFIPSSPVAKRTRRQLRNTQSADNAKAKDNAHTIDSAMVQNQIRISSKQQSRINTNIPSKAFDTAGPTSTTSIKPYIPSFPERQDSKAYSPTTFDFDEQFGHGHEKNNNIQVVIQSADLSRKPRLSDTRNDVHVMLKKGASFAENLVDVQDENLEPINDSSAYETADQTNKPISPHSSQGHLSSGRVLRSCLKSVPKTDRRQNESPSSSQQRYIDTPYRKPFSNSGNSSEAGSVLALAFPSISFLPSAEPQGTATENTGTLRAWNLEEEGQGGAGMFGRFGLISAEDDEDDADAADVARGMEEAVKFLEVDFDL